MKVIQICISDAEEIELKDKALAAGWATPSDYVKNLLFPESTFQKHYATLMKRVKEAPENFIFSVGSLMGDDWRTLDKGTRLALGRVFYKQVKSKDNNLWGIITISSDTGFQQYLKTC